MLKEQAKLFTKLAILVDAIAVVVAFYAAYYVRSLGGNVQPLNYYTWILFVVLPIWYYLFAYFDLYVSLRTRSLVSIFLVLAKIHIIGGLVIASSVLLLDREGFSRLLIGYFVLFSMFFTFLERGAVRLVLASLRKKGYNFRNILIVGGPKRSQRLMNMIEENTEWGFKIIGVLSYGDSLSGHEIAGYPILGRIENIVDVCEAHIVDEVVFWLPKEQMKIADDYLPHVESMGITVRMVLDIYASRQRRGELDYLQQLPIMTFHCKPFDAEQLFLKRCMDISGAIVGLGLTALLFPFIALAIKLDSPGPLFFAQRRAGVSGRIFTCLKFRSMYVDAEERKSELMHMNEMQGALFKIKNDPRITRVGAFLRKTSLDELPQFWNVLTGEMSLVGTRPPTQYEVSGYEHWHRKRICIKPGMTGMWQVSGRNKIHDFDAVARLDIEYIEKWTLWLDIKILLKTVRVVFFLDGSY